MWHIRGGFLIVRLSVTILFQILVCTGMVMWMSVYRTTIRLVSARCYVPMINEEMMSLHHPIGMIPS